MIWSLASGAERIAYDRERYTMESHPRGTETLCDGCGEWAEIAVVTVLPRRRHRSYCAGCASPGRESDA